jgi:ribonuclease HI
MNVVIYCDGAVKNNGGPGRIGMGAVLLQELMTDPDGKRVSKSRLVSWGMELERATNIRAELEAIYRSILLIKDEMVPRVTVSVHTDSEWSIRTFQGLNKSTVYPELRQNILNRFRQFKSWELCYVEGHAGHQFNEMADELASRQADTWKKASTQLPKAYEEIELEDE